MFATIRQPSRNRLDKICEDDFTESPQPSPADDSSIDELDLARQVKQANVPRQINVILKEIHTLLENPTGDPTVKYKGHVLKETVDFLSQHGFKVVYQAYDRYNNTQWALIYPDDDKVYLEGEIDSVTMSA